MSQKRSHTVRFALLAMAVCAAVLATIDHLADRPYAMTRLLLPLVFGAVVSQPSIESKEGLISRLWKRFRRRSLQARIPHEGVGYVVILIVLMWGSLLGHSNLLLLVFAIMAGPWIVNGGLCYGLLKGIDLRRRAPKRVMAGEPFSVELKVTNAKRFLSSWMLVATDKLAHAQEQLTPQVLYTRVPARSERSVHYQVRLSRRGLYQMGPVRVSTQFPLGLAERILTIQESGEILVYPRLGELSPRWMRQTKRAQELVQQANVRRGSFDDEFHRLREYRTGDDPRSIHWRTSARQNELMVREYHQSRADDLTVLVDLWQPSRPTREDLTRLELAISFAGTVGFEHCAQARGSNLSLSLFAAECDHWEGIAGPYGVDPFLERLALAEGSSNADLLSFFEQVFSGRNPQGRIVLITTRPTSGFDDQNGQGGGGNGQDQPLSPLHVAAAKQLNEFLCSPETSLAGAELEIVEADPAQLAGLFQLRWDQPEKR